MRGVYTLVIKVKEGFRKNVGRLGPVDFEPGLYLYTGSGVGRASSIDDRLLRHLGVTRKKRFWHVDYLLEDPRASPLAAVVSTSGKAGECLINGFVAKCLNVKLLKEGFGSSDCRCSAHLMKVREERDLSEVVKLVLLAYKRANLRPSPLFFKR